VLFGFSWFVLRVFVNYFLTVDFILFNIMSENTAFIGQKSSRDHVFVTFLNICVDNFVHGL